MLYVPTRLVQNPNAKCAVYVATRNIYQYMLPSIRSLIAHTNVDRIYLLVEDDELPYKLPNECEIINMTGQTMFLPSDNHYNTYWSYMILFRVALDKIFPNLNRILSLDVDTIITEDISDIWDIPLGDNYLAATEEPDRRCGDVTYHNMGVTLFNLKKIREDDVSNKMIQAIKTEWYQYPEQDCINKYCQGKIFNLPSEYNSGVVGASPQRKIIHFACCPTAYWWQDEMVKRYKNYNG